jgi:DNA-binding IclR family transcriptional regulator
MGTGRLRRMRGVEADAGVLLQDSRTEITSAIGSVAENGYCAASWQPEVAAVAAPLVFQGAHYALNVSLSSAEDFQAVVRELAPTLMELKQRILRQLEAGAPD